MGAGVDGWEELRGGGRVGRGRRCYGPLVCMAGMLADRWQRLAICYSWVVEHGWMCWG